MTRSVYVASSWRNAIQAMVVRRLREAGLEAYDFRDPSNPKGAFRWSDLGVDRPDDWLPEDWSPERCIAFLDLPRAVEAFEQDFGAMQKADLCVLVLPAGRSANLEAGWFVGRGKPLVVLKDWGAPDLMYRMATRVVATPEAAVVAALDCAGGRLPSRSVERVGTRNELVLGEGE